MENESPTFALPFAVTSLFTFAKIGFDLLAFRNVVIDFNYRAVIEQLLPAFYNDFAAFLADVAQFARAITFILKLSNPLGKFDREFGLQQRVAAAPDRLARCKPVKSFGSGVPEFDHSIQTPS